MAVAQEARRRALVDALGEITPEMRARLRELQEWGKAESERPDFVWHMLLQSFATLGGSRGWHGLIGTPHNYDRVTFERLSKHDARERHEVLQNVFRDAGIRYADRKAVLMARNYDLVEGMGGLEEARKKALAGGGKEAKIAFMEGFANIGPKYARNIWMDACHPDFRDTIAVDSRVQEITEALGRSFATYGEEERFYQGIAEESDLSGWELDRLLYNFKAHFLSAIARSEDEHHATRA